MARFPFARLPLLAAVLLLFAAAVAARAGYYGGGYSHGGGSYGYGGSGRHPPGRRPPAAYGSYSYSYSVHPRPLPHTSNPPPSPLFASPSPMYESPSPRMSDPCGSETLVIELGYTTFGHQASTPVLPTFTSGLALLLGSPDTCAVTSAFSGTPGRKRSLLSTDPTWAETVVVTITSADAANAAQLLEGADDDGSLAALLQLLGGQLGAAWYTAFDAEGNVLIAGTLHSGVASVASQSLEAPSPSALPPLAPLEGVPALVAEAPELALAPAPAKSTTLTSDAPVGVGQEKQKSHLGAILGGAIGGGLGGLAVGSLLLYLFLRRRNNSGAASVPTGTFAVANPAYAEAGATVTLTTARGKAGSGKFALEEIIETNSGTPRSARRRNRTVFNDAGEGAPQPEAS
ncbi:hypothetical protein ABPG75_006523 [Micractinium tetrahymenae]